MIIKMHLKALFVGVLVIVSSGCAEKVQERRGQSIEAIPVEHTYSFIIKKTGQTKVEVFELIDENLDVLIEKGSQLVWHTQQGKQLADLAAEYMRNKGVNSKLIFLERTDMPNEHLFDLTLRYTHYKTVTNVCTYESISRFGYGETGCYSDNARWQSMVNPEKMLNSVR
ncbi:hypothetical protein [Vibrio cyclitrophicus]|uniref:hypothetical protein n=1 Tax=Vibrio cyclitrophicus TaxID=47951 RepID=UPI000C823770|nr:hypothetical protein [Vibrio cyclitrophicus]PMG13885.1 hypothetical protein BCU99_12210 [Vibrio cyclitrophicus]PMN21539.1 hypothetical protein BCT37_13345 [Vibrio cyclitrophicus]